MEQTKFDRLNKIVTNIRIHKESLAGANTLNVLYKLLNVCHSLLSECVIIGQMPPYDYDIQKRGWELLDEVSGLCNQITKKLGECL